MPAASSQGLSYEEAVAGWAEHLRSGGTTDWATWLAGPGLGNDPIHPRPDGVHLELVRRLNLAAEGPVPELADLVLATPSPGRGLVEVPLPFPGEIHRFGSPAVEPALLPEEELIRLATGVLLRLLPGTPPQEEPAPPGNRPVPWRRRFRLYGPPGTVAEVRHGLLEQGLVETNWWPTHVVLAGPVDAMMAEYWAANARAGGIRKWVTLWRRQQAVARLPRSIDVVTLAQGLEGRRREPVHIVVARDRQEAAEQAARILHARPFVTTGVVDPAATDLHRRVNRLTALIEGRAQYRNLATRLAALLDGLALPGPTQTLSVPREALPWARERAADLVRDLGAAGYAVHGDPAWLTPTDHEHSGTVDRTRTLELAVAACARAWRLQEGAP